MTPTTAEHRAERVDNVIVTVAPDATVEVTITPTADQVGEWDLGCFSGGGCHYEAGLQGTLTVEESAPVPERSGTMRTACRGGVTGR